MKKILSIIGSLTLTSSAVSTVLACQTTTEKSIIENKNSLNDLNNLIGAISSEAKSMIIDNEFQFNQSISRDILNNMLAKDNIVGFNQADDNFNDQTLMQDVVNTYLETQSNDYTNLNSANVKLGNQKGTQSGIERILPDSIKEILPENIKSLLLNLMKIIEQNSSSKDLVEFLNQTLSDDLTGVYGNVVSQIKDAKIDNLIATIKQFKDPVSVFFKSLFTNETIFKTIRNLNNDLFKDDNLENLIYGPAKSDETQDESSTTKFVGDIALVDVKKEISKSIANILDLILESSNNEEDPFKDLINDDNRLSFKIAEMITNLITQKSNNFKTLTESTIKNLVVESMRLMTILNAYFSLFDDVKTFKVQDSQHLFDASKNNYEFLNDKAKKYQTLNDLDYVKERAFNINYFIANMDYYFGTISNDANSSSAYRIQQGLFILFNDPNDKIIGNPNNFSNKPSYLLEQFLNVGLIMGMKLTSGNSQKTILDIFKNNTLKDSLLNTFIKPFFLGLINGENIKNQLGMIKSFIKNLPNLIPELALFEEYLVDIVNIFDKIQINYPNNTLHHLLTDDLRFIFKDLKTINESLINRWFEKDQKVNFQTMLTQPISKMLQIFNFKTFDPNSILGETFLNDNVPSLIHLLNNYFNGFKLTTSTDNLDILSYEDLKIMNWDFNLLNKFITKIIGDDKQLNTNFNGELNLFSNMIESLFSDEVENKNGVNLNFKAMTKRLGMETVDIIKKDSFLDVLFKLGLPNLKNRIDNNQLEYKINISVDELDLLSKWFNNFQDIINRLIEVPDYKPTIKKMLAIEDVFKIDLKTDELSYFVSDPKIINKITLKVEFKNPLNLQLTNYLFRLERNDAKSKFKFINLTSDKIIYKGEK